MYHDVGESAAWSLADEVATFILRGLLLADLPRVCQRGLDMGARLSRQVEGVARPTEQASSL
jgi:hypothetical protein